MVIKNMLHGAAFLLGAAGAGRLARAQQISAGYIHSVAVAVGGELVGWGNDLHNRASGYPAGKTWALVSAGSVHTCGVTASGEGCCWGNDSSGQVSGLPSGKEWSSIEAGNSHTCGVTTSGEALCWGRNNYGQLNVPAGKEWAQISAGRGLYTCGVTTVGEGMCWGYNSDNQVSGIPPNKVWLEIQCGNSHTCGVTTSGEALCWGRNTYGQLNELNVTAGKKWAQISAGQGWYTCGVTTSGEGRCWGYQQAEKLSVPAGETWAQLSTSSTHTCGTTTSGKALCWGYNNDDQTTVPTTLARVDLAPAGFYRPGKDNLPCPDRWTSRPGAITVLGCSISTSTPAPGAPGSAVVVSGSSFASCEYGWNRTWTCSDGPGDYGNNERAVMRLYGPGWLRFLFLETQDFGQCQCCAYIRMGVNGVYYCSGSPSYGTLLHTRTRILAGSSLAVEWGVDIA